MVHIKYDRGEMNVSVPGFIKKLSTTGVRYFFKHVVQRADDPHATAKALKRELDRYWAKIPEDKVDPAFKKRSDLLMQKLERYL